MKLKKMVVGALFGLSLISFGVNADVRFQKKSVSGQDICEGLTGPWVGGGTMTAKILGVTVKCDYYGDAVVTEPSPHNYSVDVVFDLQSGSALCPGRQTYTLPGTCDSQNGNITLKSDDVNLWGTINESGTQASLEGTVRVTIKGKSIIGTVNQLDLVKQ